MEKEKILSDINNYISVILTSPELFNDGIDEELATLLLKIKKYLESEEK